MAPEVVEVGPHPGFGDDQREGLRVNRQDLSLPVGLTEATLGNRLLAIYRAFAPTTASRATPGKCEHANRL